jgi:hypothetical protein
MLSSTPLAAPVAVTRLLAVLKNQISSFQSPTKLYRNFLSVSSAFSVDPDGTVLRPFLGGVTFLRAGASSKQRNRHDESAEREADAFHGRSLARRP